MPKSKDAFRTISEVADWLETPAHVLRFWESKFTHVKPVKRAGGRRYYRPADMKLLGGIKKLLHDDGLTIKGAQKLLREHGVKHVAALSQPLDEDLLDDEDLIEEAAYEPDAQAEPVAEPEVKVLSFPSRAETQDSAPTTPEAEAAKEIETPEVAKTASAQLEEPVEETPEDLPENVAAAPETPVVETPAAEEAPAFGGDALPAFMRRAPAATPPEDPQVEDVPEATPAQEEPAAKLTIDPVARFEPVDAAEEPSEVVEEQAVLEEAKPANPIFSHRLAQNTPSEPSEPVVDAAADETSEAKVAQTEPTPAPITYDVPSAAKVAPPLDSYDAPAGVLSALQGTRRIAPELAADLGTQLDALRALRTRMQNH